MQKGSISKVRRNCGPEVWEFRWREPGPDGKRKQRKMVVGTVLEFPTAEEALLAVQALLHAVDNSDPRVKTKPIRMRSLIQHYFQTELANDNTWKSHATKVGIRGYIEKWILPRWGEVSFDGRQSSSSRTMASSCSSVRRYARED